MLDGNVYKSSTKTFSLIFDQVYHIRVEHRIKVVETNIYRYTIQIDNDVTYYDHINPPDLSNVKVYMGDKWFKPADATISYFDYGPL